jgi:hypothetical protein
MDDPGCRIFNPRTIRSSEDLAVRAKSKWTPGGIVLWLIAAAAATFIVCSQAPPESAPPSLADDVEVEVEFVE